MGITAGFRLRLHRLGQYLVSEAFASESAQRAEDDLAADPQSWLPWMESHAGDPITASRFRFPQTLTCLQIDCCGATWNELAPHLWLQRLPTIDLQAWSLQPSLSHDHRITLLSPPVTRKSRQETLLIAINLEFPSLDRAVHWLSHLRTHSLIWDPDSGRVKLLRALGLTVEWLNSETISNHWLHSPGAVNPECWSRSFGLPAPEAENLLVLGPAGRVWELASSAEAFNDKHRRNLPRVDYWPGWPELIVQSPTEGLARAGWLQAAANSAARLVHAGTPVLPGEWHLLDACQTEPICLPTLSTPDDLRAFHRGHALFALAEERLSPETQIRWEWSSGQPAQVSVLVSLYNYSGRIADALEGVALQKSGALELIVVDDASTDDGVAVVVAWMEQLQSMGRHPFVRLLLLSHSCNSGLAAARNTAFASAKANWCFVLDADNALYPRAVEACLSLAEAGPDDLAVVHPLIAVEAEFGRPDEQRSLVSTASWQRARLARENTVDAMALVRWRAWKNVQGYSHIDGGWEDYDFWCKLIGAGWHGVQCPQILAVYRSHFTSMSHTATNRSWRALSRTLQARHPWLELPLASP